ncbi:MAG: hypothetical protein H0T15_03240 [Thermoleophilaceae bacterium]|nr:hypothetical protein [Thermoleophilaceae bacterium]
MRFAWRYLMPVMRLLPNVHSTKTSGRALARLVLGPELEGVSGKYFDGSKEAASSEDSYDEAKARDLWETSENLVRLAR